MSKYKAAPFNLTSLLQRWKRARQGKPAADDRDYANLLRYTLQLAAEREIVAGLLEELSELLERNAPDWYADDQRERVESALELLQRL